MRLFAGRYEIGRRLGAGGMAEVWAARDTRLDRDVAVKILRREIIDPAAAQRFPREASAIARVTHPNIVAVYDAGTDDGRPYLVMELVDGVTVRRLLDSGPLPVASAMEIAVGICDALTVAHRAGVIHRDVKPGNVIRANSGTVKILDFGIAKSLHTDADPLTETATVVGTSHYLAPERVHSKAADARSDLYSLGCLLYEMLTGSPPFDADHPFGVLHRHLHAEPEPIQHHRPDVPAPLASLVTRLLAKDPRDRPASAAEVARTLRTADHDIPSTPTKVYPTLSTLERRVLPVFERWALLVLERWLLPVLERWPLPVLERWLPVLERWLMQPRTRVLIALASAAAALYAVVALALWPGDEAADRSSGHDSTPGLNGRLVSLEPDRKP